MICILCNKIIKQNPNVPGGACRAPDEHLLLPTFVRRSSIINLCMYVAYKHAISMYRHRGGAAAACLPQP